MAANDPSPCSDLPKQRGQHVGFGFDIANQFIECPIEWQNFVLSVNPTGNDEAAVDEALARDYNAVMTYRTGPKIMKLYGWRYLPVRSKIPTIIFQDENMVLWFKMRWS